MIQRRPGYVLILAVLMIGVVTVLLTTIVGKVIVFNRLQRVLIDRESARLLARSGVEIACAQLGKKRKVEEIFELVNQEQIFKLTKKDDGIDGEIKIFVTAEQGKIPLNALYDFKKKAFVKNAQFDGQKVLGSLGNSLGLSVELLIEAVTSLLKEQTEPLEDVSMLFTDARLQKIPLEKLFDIFTVEQKGAIQPLFLSRGVEKALGLAQLDQKQKEALTPEIKKLSGKISWQQTWDKLLAPLYGKQYNAIESAIRHLFVEEFETLSFSVVSYGKFGELTVKVYAILKAVDNKAVNYCIKKWYWLS